MRLIVTRRRRGISIRLEIGALILTVELPQHSSLKQQACCCKLES